MNTISSIPFHTKNAFKFTGNVVWANHVCLAVRRHGSRGTGGRRVRRRPHGWPPAPAPARRPARCLEAGEMRRSPPPARPPSSRWPVKVWRAWCSVIPDPRPPTPNHPHPALFTTQPPHPPQPAPPCPHPAAPSFHRAKRRPSRLNLHHPLGFHPAPPSRRPGRQSAPLVTHPAHHALSHAIPHTPSHTQHIMPYPTAPFTHRHIHTIPRLIPHHPSHTVTHTHAHIFPI